jgi:demethylmenaquinone methyltransferase/2-methoxy-6-polyprenyl-1,4-benzoquinol methylase
MREMEGQKGMDEAVRDDDQLAPDLAAQSGGSFTIAVREMFGSLAGRYDAFNHWASLGLDYGWRRAAVRSLQLPADAMVLDVATGTGDLALAAARRARHTSGFDFSPQMIEIAARKATRKSSVNVEFQVARAEQMPYADGSFHGATSAFAMRNVKPMLDDVLEEIHRVLRPGGRVAILEFSRPPLGPVRWAHRLYIRSLMPRIGRWLTGTSQPFEYLHRSIESWLSPVELVERLRAAGLAEVDYRRLALGTVALHTGRKPE